MPAEMAVGQPAIVVRQDRRDMTQRERGMVELSVTGDEPVKATRDCV